MTLAVCPPDMAAEFVTAFRLDLVPVDALQASLEADEECPKSSRSHAHRLLKGERTPLVVEYLALRLLLGLEGRARVAATLAGLDLEVVTQRPHADLRGEAIVAVSGAADLATSVHEALSPSGEAGTALGAGERARLAGKVDELRRVVGRVEGLLVEPAAPRQRRA